jgi:hypothetical protein
MQVPSPPEQIEMVINEREQKDQSERIISDIELEGYETDHTKSHKKIQKPTGPNKKSVSLYQESPTVSESTVEGDTILQIAPDV